MRRCGKSYLLFQIFKKYLLEDGVSSDHIIEMLFDTFENRRFRDPDILYPWLKEQIKDDGMYYFLLDEVQLLGEFEAVLNSLIISLIAALFSSDSFSLAISCSLLPSSTAPRKMSTN